MLTRMSLAADDGVLLIAHGTVSNVAQLPNFLSEIRRGRPASAALVAEMTRRYELIGGSPLLRISHEQANLLSARLNAPVLVGMRFGECLIADALRAAAGAAIRRLVVVPLAPYSVSIYFHETQQCLALLQANGERVDLSLVSVGAWGEHPRLIDAFKSATVAAIDESAAFDAPVIATAHSLPLRVIDSGDTYAEQVQASAATLQKALGRQVLLAYQSQGEGGGSWLGPTLLQQLERLAESGIRQVVVMPIGFLSDHVETLYDLDHEARSQAEGLGIRIIRVPALNTRPELIECLQDLVLAKTSGEPTV
jgi:ferrochelatase